MAAGRSRPRRVSLPGVADLLRPAPAGYLGSPGEPGRHGEPGEHGRPVSGREPHPHKITVYLSAQELVDLEQARLALRGYGVTVDRGRLVREAIAVLLADLALQQEASVAVRRLGGAGRTDPAGGR